MEENNGKGPGIFYAVVGIATLVVAIIGATFAYFTATSSVDNTTIKGSTAGAPSISLAVAKVHPVDGDVGYTATSKMIPLESGETNVEDSPIEATSKLAEALSHKCVDQKGNEACQVYSATITNTSANVEADITTLLQLNVPEELTNMRWQLLNGTNYNDFAVTGNVINDHTSATAINTSEHLTAGSSATYYFLIWLEETGATQDAEMSKTFSGSVTANVIGGTGITTAQTTATFSS